MKNNWSTKKISECLDRLPKKKGLPKKQYKESGNFPVIDQGQEFVGGFTDNEDLLYKENLPVIVFGDHTRALKYVDFPFAVGADGTQILKPTDDLEPKFFYYILKSLNIETRGYARHFKLLKEKEIFVPPLTKQKKIVAKLEKLLAKVNEAKKLRAEAEVATSQLLPAELHKIFEEGKKKGWEEKMLSDICEKVRNIQPKNEFRKEFKYIDISSIHSGKGIVEYKIFSSTGSIPSRARRSIKTNDTLFALTRPYLRNIARVEKDYDCAVASTGFAVLRSNREILDSSYLYYVVISDWFMDKIIPLQTGATYPAVAESKIFMQKIPFPPLSEQKKIVARLDSISEKVHQLQEHQKATTNDLLSLEQSILSKVFSSDFV